MNEAPRTTPESLDLPAYRAPWTLRHPALMTAAAAVAPWSGSEFERAAADEWFEVGGGPAAGGARVLARTNWSERPDAPLAVLLHGLTGSAESAYLQRVGAKLHAAGFHVVRLNARNCSETERHSATIYHAALSEDPAEVLAQLAERLGSPPAYLVGFSMGGSIALRLAGLHSDDSPGNLQAVVTVSAPLELVPSSRRLESSAFARLLTRRFLGNFEHMLTRREEHWPGRNGCVERVARCASLWQFDSEFTAPLAGFPSVEAYYESASPWTRLDRIRLPGLLLHALDDPVVDPAAYSSMRLAAHPSLRAEVSPRGGHVGFLAGSRATGPRGPDPDRRWAENRVVDFLCWHASDPPRA